MATIISTLILIAVLFLAIRYIINAKKKGVKCIGCPDGKSCNSDACCCIDADEILNTVSILKDDK